MASIWSKIFGGGVSDRDVHQNYGSTWTRVLRNRGSISSLFSSGPKASEEPASSHSISAATCEENVHYPLYNPLDPEHNTLTPSTVRAKPGSNFLRTRTPSPTKSSTLSSVSPTKSLHKAKSSLLDFADSIRAKTSFFYDEASANHTSPGSARSRHSKKSVRFRSTQDSYDSDLRNSSPINIPIPPPPSLQLDLPTSPLLKPQSGGDISEDLFLGMTARPPSLKPTWRGLRRMSSSSNLKLPEFDRVCANRPPTPIPTPDTMFPLDDPLGSLLDIYFVKPPDVPRGPDELMKQRSISVPGVQITEERGFVSDEEAASAPGNKTSKADVGGSSSDDRGYMSDEESNADPQNDGFEPVATLATTHPSFRTARNQFITERALGTKVMRELSLEPGPHNSLSKPSRVPSDVYEADAERSGSEPNMGCRKTWQENRAKRDKRYRNVMADVETEEDNEFGAKLERSPDDGKKPALENELARPRKALSTPSLSRPKDEGVSPGTRALLEDADNPEKGLIIDASSTMKEYQPGFEGQQKSAGFMDHGDGLWSDGHSEQCSSGSGNSSWTGEHGKTVERSALEDYNLRKAMEMHREKSPSKESTSSMHVETPHSTPASPTSIQKFFASLLLKTARHKGVSASVGSTVSSPNPNQKPVSMDPSRPSLQNEESIPRLNLAQSESEDSERNSLSFDVQANERPCGACLDGFAHDSYIGVGKRNPSGAWKYDVEASERVSGLELDRMPASSPSTPTATRPSRSTRLPRFIPISKTEMLVLKVDESTTESPTSSPSSRRDALARIQDHMMENPTNEQLALPIRSHGVPVPDMFPESVPLPSSPIKEPIDRPYHGVTTDGNVVIEMKPRTSEDVEGSSDASGKSSRSNGSITSVDVGILNASTHALRSSATFDKYRSFVVRHHSDVFDVPNQNSFSAPMTDEARVVHKRCVSEENLCGYMPLSAQSNGAQRTTAERDANRSNDSNNSTGSRMSAISGTSSMTLPSPENVENQTPQQPISDVEAMRAWRVANGVENGPSLNPLGLRGSDLNCYTELRRHRELLNREKRNASGVMNVGQAMREWDEDEQKEEEGGEVGEVSDSDDGGFAAFYAQRSRYD